MLRRTTYARTHTVSEYDTPHDGRAREDYLGEVSVDRRTYEQQAHAVTTFDLTWPEAAVQVRSTMDVSITGAGIDVEIETVATLDGDVGLHAHLAGVVPRPRVTAPARYPSVRPASGRRTTGRSGPAGPARTSATPSPARPVTRSASSRPKVGANLKPWPAPRPTTSDGCPGTRSMTKSRSGVSVYWQRSDRTGGAGAGQHPAQVPGEQVEHRRVGLACRGRPGRPSGRRSPAPP